MTLIVAICITEEKGEQCLLISSDSQATMGPITYRVHKIAPIREPIQEEEPIAIVAGAGDTAIIKKAIDISEHILWETSNINWENETPTFDQFKQVIPKIEIALIQMIQFYKTKKVDINFEFLLGSVSPEGYASLYYFDRRGLAQPVHDDPGFACIGSGFFLGGNLLLQQFYSNDMDFEDALQLTTYVINQVSMVDSNVGPFEGESFYFGLRDGKSFLGSITANTKFLKELRTEYDSRQELLKYVWRESVFTGSKRLKQLIRKAVKNWEKAEKKAKKNKQPT